MKLLATLFILLLALRPVVAQDISPALLKQIEDIESFTAQTRGLEALKPIDRRFPTRAAAIEEITRLVMAEMPPDEAERATQFYLAFDFLPPGSDYLALYIDALEAQVGGFYDPDTKAMNTLLINDGTLGDELPLLEQIIYSHEFVHALQDQHFDINQLEALVADNPDQMQAVIALIEGDATLVMNLYTQEISQQNPLGTALQLLAQGMRANALFLPPDLPDIIASELLSAYTNGVVFVSTIQANGGWEAVNRAFEPEHLPQSTEQILHPAKYLAGENPLPVDLVAPALDAGWETVWDTTFGEFYLREYLKTQLPRAQATEAAAGWGGDHYQVYRNSETGQLAWLMRIEWDSARDSREFSDAYTDFLVERFVDVVAVDSCWASAVEALCFTDDGGYHLIAHAPTLSMAQALIGSQG